MITVAPCRYTFPYPQLPLRCPDCGKTQYRGRQAVRSATAQEIKDYYRIKAEIAAEDKLAANQQNTHSGRKEVGCHERKQ